MSNEILEKIKSDLNNNKVMLYMKGTPEMPQCGFSFRAVEILKALNVKFGSTDILPDPNYRMVLSEYSNWPTIPQLFVDGKLVGGSDIMTDLYENGELQELLGSVGAFDTTEEEAS